MLLGRLAGEQGNLRIAPRVRRMGTGGVAVDLGPLYSAACEMLRQRVIALPTQLRRGFKFLGFAFTKVRPMASRLISQLEACDNPAPGESTVQPRHAMHPPAPAAPG